MTKNTEKQQKFISSKNRETKRGKLNESEKSLKKEKLSATASESLLISLLLSSPALFSSEAETTSKSTASLSSFSPPFGLETAGFGPLFPAARFLFSRSTASSLLPLSMFFSAWYSRRLSRASRRVLFLIFLFNLVFVKIYLFGYKFSRKVVCFLGLSVRI